MRELINQLLTEYPFVSILSKKTKQKNIRIDLNSSNVSQNTTSGYVFKLFKDEHYYEYSCNQLPTSIDVIKNKIEMPKALRTNAKNIPMIHEEPLTKTFIRANVGKDFTNEEITNKLNELKQLILGYDSKIVSVTILYSHREEESSYLSKQKDLKQSYTWTNLNLMIVSKDDKTMKTAYNSQGENSIERCIEKAFATYKDTCQLAIDLLDATSIEPGLYDVITDPSISGLIAHEAFGHGVELDMFVKNRAKAKDYVGKYVASNIVSMKDGAASCISAASYFFDDDGVLAHDTTIIENGILKSGISDSISALQLGLEPTGNGRRESYIKKAYSRMTNTFFMPGNDSLEDMIASIKHGYLICETSNGMEDPKNWQIQCVAQYGREIKDGKFTGKIVSPVVISGYVPDLLQSISMISKEDTLEIHGSGACGKGYKEWVYVSDGGPYMKAKVKLG